MHMEVPWPVVGCEIRVEGIDDTHHDQCLDCFDTIGEIGMIHLEKHTGELVLYPAQGLEIVLACYVQAA